ncbi:NAD(P)-binding protein [Paxillus ammoniavirescens]|nr:NAD(P)-binding protein [Paxillus ammoniavirescens]
MSIPTTIREYRTKADDYHNLKLHEAPFSKPRPSEVTIRIHAVSLQYRDLLISKGMYSGQKTDLVPGSDGAGEIVAFGEDVKGWKVGDRVCPSFALDYLHGDVTVEIMQTGLGGNIDGVLREYINVPAHSLVRIPPHLTYEEASTLPCAALTAYNALMGPVPLKGGDHVLVLGTGGVSIFGAQIALASGAIVIATSSSDEKLQVAKKLGVQHVINYKKTPNWEAEVLKITGGRGVDHVIEVGGPNTILKCAQAVRYVGNVHVIGFLSGGDHGIPIDATIRKAITFRGILIGSVKQFEDMNRLFIARQIHPLIDRVYPFEQVIDAYSYLESQKHVGKVVIKLL